MTLLEIENADAIRQAMPYIKIFERKKWSINKNPSRLKQHDQKPANNNFECKQLNNMPKRTVNSTKR